MMEIRLLEPSDFYAWKRLRLAALKDTPEFFSSSYEEEVHCTKKEWEMELHQHDIFGAFIDEVLVGAAGFYTLNNLKTQHRGVLFGLYTIPRYRGQHVASTLIRTIIGYAKPQVSQIYLKCVVDNENAIKLYEKHGFRIFGTIPQALKIGDHFVDEHLMGLDLETATVH